VVGPGGDIDDTDDDTPPLDIPHLRLDIELTDIP